MSRNRKTADIPASAKYFTGVRAVAFDAVGTVMYPQPTVAEAYQQAIERHCGVTIAADEVRSAVRTALRARSDEGDLRTDETAEHEFWADLIQRLCPDSEGFQACFDDLFQHFAAPGSWRCYPEVAEVIRYLQSQNIRIVIASNFDRRLNPVCDGLPELSGVTERVISSVVGWRKPAPEFFAAVAEQLNTAPKNVLFVGDDLINDVEGAHQAGMQTAWVHRDTSADAVPDVTRLTSLLDIRVEACSTTDEARTG